MSVSKKEFIWRIAASEYFFGFNEYFFDFDKYLFYTNKYLFSDGRKIYFFESVIAAIFTKKSSFTY